MSVNLQAALRAAVRAPIVVYRVLVAPALPQRCKYEPTCSSYALQAIDGYGPARGLVLAAWRLLRCNPFSRGGYDPVEAQRIFKAPPHARGQHPAARPAQIRSPRIPA
jgi:uncharacterized protein